MNDQGFNFAASFRSNISKRLLYCASPKMKARTSGVTQCPLSFAQMFDMGACFPLPSSITYSTGVLAKLFKVTQGFGFSANAHVSDLAYADDIVIMRSRYR